MTNQQAVVDQIVRNLAFDVEAVPKNKSIEENSISQITPLNVKIKVRKKEEIQTFHEDITITDDTPKTVQKVRLVNSDRTIMTFDVFMEAEFDKKPSRKFHKQIFDMLRPGMCLGAVDDDKYSYMPSSSYSANITEPTKATKSDGTFKQTFTLSKNVYQDYTVSTQQEEPKWLFGKCKPGGCLDPPFSEDKYPYKPSTRSGPEQDEGELDEDVGTEVYSDKKPTTLRDEETQSNERRSSIFDNGIFKKKRRSSDKSTNTKLPDKTDSIVDIYQGESATNSVSPQSNSIITYPPTTRSVPRMSDDKTVTSRGSSEEKPRRSFNDHSEPYFIPPKGVNRIREKDTLDPSDYTKRRSSDIKTLKPPAKEPLKMPVPLPIPITVSIPKISSTQKLEAITPNDDLVEIQDDNMNVTELDSIPDQSSQEQQLQDKNTFSKTESFISANVEESTTSNETGDKNLDDTKLVVIQDDNVIVTELDSIPEQASEEQQLQDKNTSSKTESFISAHVEEPTTSNETGDKNLDDTKLVVIQDDNANVTELDSIPEQTSEEQQLQDKNTSSKTESFISANVEEPTTSNEIGDKNLDDTKLVVIQDDNANVTELDSISEQTSEEQQLQDKNTSSKTENFMSAIVEEPTASNEIGDKSLDDTKSQQHDNLPVPLPIPVPFNLSNPVATAVDSKTKNDKLVTSDMNLIQSKESLTTKPTPPTNEDTPFGASKQKNIDPENKLEENESTLNTKPQYSDTEANEIPKEYLRTGRGDSDQESDSENSVNKALIITEMEEKQDSNVENITKRIDKPTKQNEIKNEDTAAKTDKGDRPSEIFNNNILQLRGSSETDERKNSQRISQSKLPILQRSVSLLNGSKTSTASAKDKRETKGSGSLDKYLNNVGDRGSDLGNILSGSRTSSATAKDKSETKGSGSLDKYLNNVGDRDSDLGSILSRSRKSSASAKDNRDTQRSDSPDKYLDSLADKDNDLGVLPSDPKQETDSGNSKVMEPPGDKEYVGETATNNNGKIDSYAEDPTRFPMEGDLNFIAAPVFIDNTESSPKSRPLKEADSKVNSLVEPINTHAETDPSGSPFATKIPSRKTEFGKDDETHLTGSRELIGTQSVIYDAVELIPDKSAKNRIEIIPSSVKGVDTGLTSIQSTSTLKSALKKDLMYIDLGFQSYVNDKNERILKTFDGVNTPTRLPNDSVTVLKTQIRVSSNEIRIPVDSEHDMSIQIKKSNANQRVSISESGLTDNIDHIDKKNCRLKKQRPPELDNDAEIRSSEVKAEERKDSTRGVDTPDDHFIDYYEQELVPLQLIIKNLRNEIDFLASQQLVLKDKLYCSNKSKLPRLVHSNKKCYGCARK